MVKLPSDEDTPEKVSSLGSSYPVPVFIAFPSSALTRYSEIWIGTRMPSWPLMSLWKEVNRILRLCKRFRFTMVWFRMGFGDGEWVENQSRTFHLYSLAQVVRYLPCEFSSILFLLFWLYKYAIPIRTCWTRGPFPWLVYKSRHDVAIILSQGGQAEISILLYIIARINYNFLYSLPYLRSSLVSTSSPIHE